MEIRNTSYGIEVAWGLNCIEQAPHLGVMNAKIARKPKDFDVYRTRCDELHKKFIEACGQLDNICNEEGAWTEDRDHRYIEWVERQEGLLDDIYRLCMTEYPDHARECGCSYVV